MKTTLIANLVLLLAGSALAAGEPSVANAVFEAQSPAGGLESALKHLGSKANEPFWVGYSVPMVSGMGRVCCYWNDERHDKASICRLEEKNHGWGSNRDEARGEQDLHVLLRYAGGKLSQVRGLSADCRLDGGGHRFVWLGTVKPEESVAFLASLARTGQDGYVEPAGEALSTLALHRSETADAVLEELASSRYSRKKREEALFWMGQTRGERGAKFLAGVLRDDPDDKVREHAIFSLSQSAVSWAAATITKTAREDRSPHIRSQALFWLAQMKAADAPAIILAAAEKDPEASVRKQAVFALSQLHGGQAVASLLKVARGSRDPGIRKEAFFWLAQSKDPQALAFLDKTLNGD
jgi:hypothetical protein